ncbi:hypothetical protein JCM9279_005284 [Rhodotorula babjevae]
MSSQQPRITLRPPPHRDFLQGYPGIPASDPSTEPTPSPDPLFPLPHVLRPQAHLSGTVEVRAPPKSLIRARWLSVELEKVETVLPPPDADPTSKPKSTDSSRKDGRYVELIGVGPNKLWEAGVSEGADVPRPLVVDIPRKKGLKGLFSKSHKAPRQDDANDDDDGFDFIPDGNYPFSIPLPEGLPPTIELDGHYHGVAYQIVASLCIKGKQGLLKNAPKSTIVIASAAVLLNKADILPTWPAYQPILPSPLPPKLPWAAPPGSGELTTGETREARLAIRRQDGTAGEVWIKATREGLAFGPGDAVRVFVQIGWGGSRPIKLTRLDTVLRETLTYRHPSPSNQNYVVRASPKVTALFTANASVSPDPDNPSAFAVLYENEPVAFDLTGVVPNNHSRVTVRTAKHVDVAYHLKIRAMLEGGDEISVDHWPVLIGDCDSRTAKGIMRDIGWVEGLCDRAGLKTEPSSATSALEHEPARPEAQRQLSARSASPPPVRAPARQDSEQLPPAPSPIASYQDAALEKSRLLQRTYGSATGAGFHVANPSSSHDRDTNHELDGDERFGPSSSSSSPPHHLEAPAPLRPSPGALPPTAEDDKRSYYEHAARQRDALQLSVRGPDSLSAPSPTSILDHHRYSESQHSPSVEDDPASLHRAAIVHRASRDELSRSEPERSGLHSSHFIEGGPTFATAHLAPTRSNTIMALSGSDVSTSTPSISSPPPPPPPPPHVVEPAAPPRDPPTSPAALLGRSLTTAEAEKRRLFLDAKEMARKRQEEARLELERQNQALAELDFEEAQLAYEARLIAEAEDERREVERLAREAFEADRLARIAADEERWRLEEEARQAQARAEIDERRRRAEQAMQDELRRFEAHHLEAERARAAEIERQADERKREDDAKRAVADEMRRLDEERQREELERKSAAARKVEMERQRADAERRRQEGERQRLADVARREAEAAEAQRRFEEEQRARARAAEEEDARRRAEEEERYEREEEERRRYEDEERRRYEDEERHRAAEAAAASAARRAQQSSEALSTYPRTDSYDRPAYPSPPSNGRTTSYGNGVQRAPSVASFAPSTSAANATAEFYAQSIGQQSGLSDEKARYLAQLRERRAQVGSPGPYSSPSSQPSHFDPTALQPAYPQGNGYPRAPQPQSQPLPPVHPAYGDARTSPPTLPPKPPLPPHTASSAPAEPRAPTSSTSTYKTAAEEKEEAAARRRAEDAAAARRRAEEDRGKQPAIPVEDEEAPPSYPAPPAQGGSSSSAAAEKAELERYYSAKAAVDAQRDDPPSPPSRLGPAAFDREPLASPVPTYEPSSNGGGPAYPSQLDRHALRASTNTVMTHQSDSSSHELHRDPSVAAGKRAQRPPSSSAASDSFGHPAPYSPQDERVVHAGYHSPAPPQPSSYSASYINGASSPPLQQRQQHLRPYGVNSDFGTLRMDEQDEFDGLAQQMAADEVRARGGAPF